MGAVRVTSSWTPRYLNSEAELHQTRRQLLERFRSERADAADKTMEIDLGTLSGDERPLFDGLVEQGVIVSWRGGYYLDEEALKAADAPLARRAILGAIVVAAVVGGMLWLTSR